MGEQPTALQLDTQRPEALLLESAASPPPTGSVRSRGTSARRDPTRAASRGDRRPRPHPSRSARRASGPSSARPTSGAPRGPTGGDRRSRVRGAGRAARARAGRSGGTRRSPSGTPRGALPRALLRPHACAQQRQVPTGQRTRSTRSAASSPRAGGRARIGRTPGRAGSRARDAAAERPTRSDRAAGSRDAARC